MLVQITHLKAPWPDGAQVGDTINLDALPAWAVGKCQQVDDQAAEPEFIVNPAPADDVPDSMREAEQQAALELEQMTKRASKAKKG